MVYMKSKHITADDLLGSSYTYMYMLVGRNDNHWAVKTPFGKTIAHVADEVDAMVLCNHLNRSR